MGRKKKPSERESQAEDGAEIENERRRTTVDDPSEDSSAEADRRRHYDIDPEIQEFAYAFGIDNDLCQALNDIMIEDRRDSWKQDLERLYEIMKDANVPSAMLRLKIRDMQRGTFVGKARCGPKVREMAKKHRLDRGAASKLEEAMSMREAMGKDVDKDLLLLDEHLLASNAPSKLVSMKLESLRKGFNVGHCIYSREPVMGNLGPGVDGVFNRRDVRRPLGYTDADLCKRFAEHDRNAIGELMDEATVKKMLAAERKQHEAKRAEQELIARRSRSREEGRSRKRCRSRKTSRSKRRSGSHQDRRRRTSPSVSRGDARRSLRSPPSSAVSPPL